MEKKSYRVFEQTTQIFTDTGLEIKQDKCVGFTKAVSPKKAVSNVKYILRCEGRLNDAYYDSVGYHKETRYYAKEAV